MGAQSRLEVPRTYRVEVCLLPGSAQAENRLLHEVRGTSLVYWMPGKGNFFETSSRIRIQSFPLPDVGGV